MADVLSLPSTLDLSRLLIFHSILSCVTATSIRSPGYNLPVAVFGLLVVDKSSVEGLRQFGALHALTFMLDVVWLISGSRETGSLITFLLLINTFAKPVTLLALSSSMKQQGLPTMGDMGVSAFGAGQQQQQHRQHQYQQASSTVWSAEESTTPYQQHAHAYQSPDELDEEEDLAQPPSRTTGGQSKEGSGGYHTIA